MGTVYAFDVSPSVVAAYKSFTAGTPTSQVKMHSTSAAGAPQAITTQQVQDIDTTLTPAQQKAQAVAVLQNCKASAYGGNMDWVKYVDPKTCAPVVSKSVMTNPNTGK